MNTRVRLGSGPLKVFKVSVDEYTSKGRITIFKVSVDEYTSKLGSLYLRCL